MDQNAHFLRNIKSAIEPATGCTEPVAIAFNVSTARENLRGTVRAVHVKLDMCLLKYAMGVGIPGVPERGVPMCVAVGIAGGDPSLGMNVLRNISEEHHRAALDLLPMIHVGIDKDKKQLYLETILESDIDAVRVITYGGHTNIVDISHAPFDEPVLEMNENGDDMTLYTLDEFIDFANTVPLDSLGFLQEGIDMNNAIAEAGKDLRLGKCIAQLEQKGYMGDCLILKVQQVTSRASYARMSGFSLPVMTATRSGNQGITLYLTVSTVALELNISQEKTLRAIALSHLINLYAKHYLGDLSALCACGVASGLGACAGIVYMLGGTSDQIMGSMRNILGTITGMICDGAKEGCANKVSLASGLAVMAALMAMEGMFIGEDNGVLAGDMKELFANVARIANLGMSEANETIVDIMLHRPMC